METYIPVARVGELVAGAMKEVDLGGRQVLLAFVEGKYFAFSRQCPHEEADSKPGHSKAARFAAPITIIASTSGPASVFCPKGVRR